MVQVFLTTEECKVLESIVGKVRISEQRILENEVEQHSEQERVENRVEDSDGDMEDDLETRVMLVLDWIGVPHHVKGYRFIKEAVILGYRNPAVFESITKCLYPEVAKKCKSTSSRVERAIRHSIEIVFDRTEIENLYCFFGNTVSMRKGKPTNSEFITLFVDSLRIGRDKKLNLLEF